jgi:16S rRNA (adenine1518-N6/adenine1519-N6)-dimethyltransferase
LTNYKKNFGQNFLINPTIASRIVKESGASKGETVLEIGAGRGILTQCLIEKEISVIAFEIDRELFEFLKNKFEGMKVEFMFEDFLKFQGKIKADRCVSNIPYNISTPIIKKLFDLEIPSMTLMIQKEYAKRLMAKPKSRDYNSLSVFVQVRSKIDRLFDVDRKSFFPSPNVDSTVIQITRTKEMENKIKDMKKFEEIVKASFSQKRKMIRNNLKGMDMILKKAGISPTQRAEEIPVEKFIELSNLLSDDTF